MQVDDNIISRNCINNRLDETIKVLCELKNNVINIELAVQILINCYKAGNKLLICGNGGSAADAQHIAAEFVGKFYRIDRPALPAMALHTNTSAITAIANDFDYNNIFLRQIEAFGVSGDVLMGISTSGNSKNIINAVNLAKAKNIKVISLTGDTGGELEKISDLTIKVPSQNTPIIQNAHISVAHIICELVEKAF